MFPCAAYRQGHKWKRLHPEYIQPVSHVKTPNNLGGNSGNCRRSRKTLFIPISGFPDVSSRPTLANETQITHKYVNGARVTGQNKKTQFITQKNTLQIRQVMAWWPAYFWTRFPSDEAWEFTLLPANENDTSISSGDVRLMPQDNFPPSTDGLYNGAFIVQSCRFRICALF